ncbi:RBL1 [Cordylochernes scorpioides]|uniref:RBL1 n=1 Tax=Cordylochernes scorpioides TaxID=51811 RepID=A0ABY6K332_9ARAC|nr:RBL1 [Cordylochernes scorpioides]
MNSNDKDDIYQKYQELCADLNMNKEAVEEAWRTYLRINSNYTLEGDRLHWLCCSLYVACRTCKIPTIYKDGYIQGNCVSLTRLLRSSKLSLIQFFSKMKQWADMANLPAETRLRVEHLERNFNVTAVIFKKFEMIFLDLFQNPATDSSKPNRGRYPHISDDLVNSYHVLLCCIDLVYSNAVHAGLSNLLNPAAGSPGRPPPPDPSGLIQYLCQQYDGVELEAKAIKEHYWKPEIKSLLEKGALKGNLENFSGLLDSKYMESNGKFLMRKYEEHVLSLGNFDERIFLGENASEEIGTPAKQQLSQLAELRQRLIQEGGSTVKVFQLRGCGVQRGFHPSTPLTNRRFLQDRDLLGAATPVSSATQSVARLQALLAEHQDRPSPALVNIFKDCQGDPQESITKRLKEVGDLFCQAYSQPNLTDDSKSNMEFAMKRLQLARCLYFRCLDSIFAMEKKKISSSDLSNYVEHDMFHRMLFACCMEIVLFSYSSQRKFPWILHILDLQPYHFYKVIELVIRAESSLTRDVVKHLNNIEEEILESLAWRLDSPIWDILQASGQPVPMCEEVSIPTPSTPIIHSLRCLDSVRRGDSSPVLADRFQQGSPAAKRRLFDAPPAKPLGLQPGSTQSAPVLVQLAFSGENGTYSYIPITQVTVPKTQQTPTKAKRTGSLALFFRKVGCTCRVIRGTISVCGQVYHLAGVRLRDLCERLGVTSEEMRQKIWTCLEHSIVSHTELMKGRHLDQLIMCSVYIISKVLKEEQSFQDIMKCYRMQPQHASHVYRSVLLTRRKRHNSGGSETSRTESTSSSPVPSDDGGTTLRSSSTLPLAPHPQEDSEERGDLVGFYNKSSPPLSPLPRPSSSQTMSPCRRVTPRLSLYVSPLKQNSSNLCSPNKPLSYIFNQDSPQELRNINNMIKSVANGERKQLQPGKRVLTEDMADGAPPAKQPYLTFTKLQQVMNERMDPSAKKKVETVTVKAYREMWLTNGAMTPWSGQDTTTTTNIYCPYCDEIILERGLAHQW